MKKYVLVLAVLTLAACAGDSSSDSDTGDAKKSNHDAKQDQADARANLICPQVAILLERRTKADYGGEQPDPSQLVATARMQSLNGDCAYQDNGIDILYTLHLTARRGPRLGGDHESFPYFVAIVDPADTILSRQIITATFQFSSGDKTATDDEPLHVFIPLAKAQQESGPDYRVLSGFEK